MKKYILLWFLWLSVCTFALTDTDADGVIDEKDICPRVYSRSESGCPKLTANPIKPVFNACLTQALAESIILSVKPLCIDSTCSKVLSATGVQMCDPIFPVIFDTTGAVMIRGGIYIVGFTR